MEGAARIGAIVFVALALTAAVIEAARREPPRGFKPCSMASPTLVADPLRQEQRRCQLLAGQAAAADSACLHAWAQSRERFLSGSPRFAAEDR